MQPLCYEATCYCTIESSMQPNSDQSAGQTPQQGGSSNDASRQAAADLARQQLDALYGTPQPNEHAAAAAPTAQPAEQSTDDNSPYEMTHSDAEDAAAHQDNAAVNEQWRQYHTAWQQYYQLYYDRYYQAVAAQRPAANGRPAVAKRADGSLTRSEAMKELHAELASKVKSKASSARKSRHFMPVVMAATVAFVFLFLQYNQLLFAQVNAFVSPGVASGENIYIDPASGVNVSQDPKILIPKINVEAPVMYDVNTLDEPVIQQKLKDGVVHYPIPGANAMPGQTGNTVVLGHSSNDVFDDGKYKFVFVQLDRLEAGDKFYLHYNGTRYTYQVTEKKIIDPTEVNQLVINNGKPLATLVTCTPPGTALKRLIVIGEQISPDPSTASEQTADQTKPTAERATAIGGVAPSFFERLFNVSF